MLCSCTYLKSESATSNLIVTEMRLDRGRHVWPSSKKCRQFDPVSVSTLHVLTVSLSVSKLMHVRQVIGSSGSSGWAVGMSANGCLSLYVVLC